MKIFSIICLVAMTSTFAFGEDLRVLSKAEKKQVCGLFKDIVPTEQGMGVTLKECVGFDFEITEENETYYVVRVLAQTVEDMATVCTVPVLKDITREIKLQEPECELQ